MLYIFVVTENKITTRIQVECESFAETFRAAIQALGYTVSQVYRSENAPVRTEAEIQRGMDFVGVVHRQIRRSYH